MSPAVIKNRTKKTVRENQGFLGSSYGKESTCNAGDSDSVPGSGRSPGGGHGNPLQDSCLGHPGDRGAWRATVHGHKRHKTQESGTT